MISEEKIKPAQRRVLLCFEDILKECCSIIVATYCLGIRDGHMEHMTNSFVRFATVTVSLQGIPFPERNSNMGCA